MQWGGGGLHTNIVLGPLVQTGAVRATAAYMVTLNIRRDLASCPSSEEPPAPDMNTENGFKG